MKQKYYNVPNNDEHVLAYLNASVKEFVRRCWRQGDGYTSFGALGLTREEYYRTCSIVNDDIKDIVLSEIYDRGRAIGCVPWHFDDFKKYVWGALKDRWNWFPEIKEYNGWYSPSDKPQRKRYSRYFRYREESTKYVRKEHHQKKVIDEKEQSRRDWREKKRFNKRKSYACFCCGGRWYKRQDARQRRAYERRMIATGKYEEMYDHKDMFVDSWDFC